MTRPLHVTPLLVLLALAIVRMQVVKQPVHYVNGANRRPAFPYTSWRTAATNIQDAIGASAMAGRLVLVAQGIYRQGGVTVDDGGTNRIALTNPVVVRSVNGPAVTVIEGALPAERGGVAGGIRCAYVGHDAVLSGFTLMNGHAYFDPQGGGANLFGGGLRSEPGGVVSNCVVSGSSAYASGGGAYGGSLYDCTLTGNSVVWGKGGGVYGSMLYRCTVTHNSADRSDGGGAADGALRDCILTGNFAGDDGGGVSDSVVDRCTLTENRAHGDGGAVEGSTLRNCVLTRNGSQEDGGAADESTLYGCVLTGNEAAANGGGADQCILHHCTLTGNTAADHAGGAQASTLRNCIVYFNTARLSANHHDCTFDYSCTTPLPAEGSHNIVANPRLASTTHLATNSPCVGAGSASYALGVDIDGEPWLDPPCMGADQVRTGQVTGLLRVAVEAEHTEVAAGFALSFRAVVDGKATRSQWDFGDGTVVKNRPYTSHTWNALGTYRVQLTAFNDAHPGGVTAAVTVTVVERPVFYVNRASPTPVFPYRSWATAATSIQEAVGASTVPGRLVLVTNGVYKTRGATVWGQMTNRVALTNRVELRSVNGPSATIIRGSAAPEGGHGKGAIRCAYVGPGCILSGFTLTNGHTHASGDQARKTGGGGVLCEGNAIVTNCVLIGNSAFASGGGAFRGTFHNCAFAGNTAENGGGAYGATLHHCILRTNSAAGSGGGVGGTDLDPCTLYNCTLTSNSAEIGGGACQATLRNSALTRNSARLGGGAYGGSLYNCTLTDNFAGDSGGGVHSSTLCNCIVYYNVASYGANHLESTLNHTCTTPAPADGVGNITADPQLASATHLSAMSPCIDAGSSACASGADIDGEPWRDPPCMGADQLVPGEVTGPLSVDLEVSVTNVAPGFVVQLTSQIEGRTTGSFWDIGGATVVSNRPRWSQSWSLPGLYPVRLTAFNETHPEGVTATAWVHVVEGNYYVSQTNMTPEYPYTTWATAATNIQDAIDAAAFGGRVLVADGLYAAGGRPAVGILTNRVALDKPITVESLNGPGVTFIVGAPGFQEQFVTGAIRCAYVGSNALLGGFTLTNGNTSLVSGPDPKGGGAWIDPSGVLSNCIVVRNWGGFGGGAYGGTIVRCTLVANSAYIGAGAYNATLIDCVLSNNSAWQAGGAYESTLDDCGLFGNRAENDGGGVDHSTLYHCTLAGNSAGRDGGGADKSTLYDCTLTGNRASKDGGGANHSKLYDCSLTSNTAWDDGGGADTSDLYRCRLVRNLAVTFGGGAAESTLVNCLLDGNSAHAGGGAHTATLKNSTVVSNSATVGGGVNAAILQNCIVYYNSALQGSDYVYSTLNYTCTTPLPTNGTGNITGEPAFVNLAAGDYHLTPGSACIDAGTNLSAFTTDDLDRRPRPLDGNGDGSIIIDLGAYEFDPSAVTPVTRLLSGSLDPVRSRPVAIGLAANALQSVAEPGADPTEASAGVRIVAISTGPPVTIYFFGSSDQRYTLFSTTDLSRPVWTSVPEQTALGGVDGLQSVMDPHATPPRFYRIGVTAP